MAHRIVDRKVPRGWHVLRQFCGGETKEEALRLATKQTGKTAGVEVIPGHFDEYPTDGQKPGFREHGWMVLVKGDRLR